MTHLLKTSYVTDASGFSMRLEYQIYGRDRTGRKRWKVAQFWPLIHTAALARWWADQVQPKSPVSTAFLQTAKENR